MSQVFSELVAFLSKIHQMEDELLTELKNKDVTEQQQNILTILYTSGQKNLSALSSCLHINMPNCSREIRKLTEKGLIEKTAGKEDKRITEINLSPCGRSLTEKYFASLMEEFSRKTGPWNEEREKRFSDAMKTILKEISPE